MNGPGHLNKQIPDKIPHLSANKIAMQFLRRDRQVLSRNSDLLIENTCKMNVFPSYRFTTSTLKLRPKQYRCIPGVLKLAYQLESKISVLTL